MAMTKVSDVLAELPVVALVRGPCTVLITVSFLVSLDGGWATRLPSTNWSWAADVDSKVPSISISAISTSQNGRDVSAGQADDKDIRSRCDAVAAGRQHLPDLKQTLRFAAAFSLLAMI